jgi:hypothetical protein
VVEPLAILELQSSHAAIRSVLKSAAAKGGWSTELPKEQPPGSGPDHSVIVQLLEAHDGNLAELYVFAEAAPYATVSNMAVTALLSYVNLRYCHTPALRPGGQGPAIVHGDHKTPNTLFQGWRLGDHYLVWPILTDLSLANPIGTPILRAGSTHHYSCKVLIELLEGGTWRRSAAWAKWWFYEQLLAQVTAWPVKCLPEFLVVTYSSPVDDMCAWTVATRDELSWVASGRALTECRPDGSSSSNSSSSIPAWEQNVLVATEGVRRQLDICLESLQQDCQHWQLCRAWQQAVKFAIEHKLPPLRPPYDPSKYAVPAAAAAPGAASAGDVSTLAASLLQQQQQQQQQPQQQVARTAIGVQIAAPTSGGAWRQEHSSSGSMPPPPCNSYTLEQATAALEAAERQVYERQRSAVTCLWQLLFGVPGKQQVYQQMAAGKLPAGEVDTGYTWQQSMAQTCADDLQRHCQLRLSQHSVCLCEL